MTFRKPILIGLLCLPGCGAHTPPVAKNEAPSAPVAAQEGDGKQSPLPPAPPPKPPEPPRELEPWEKITQKQIEEITYEDCEDDFGVTFPFAHDFDRVGDDETRKASFKEWRDKLEEWDCNREKNVEQKVRNFISLMALVDVMQMEYEAETPLVLYERMKKEIPKEQLLKATAYCVLKPEVGTIMDKCPDIGIDDGANEDRVRDRVSVYAKKVLFRLLDKMPKEEPQAK